MKNKLNSRKLAYEWFEKGNHDLEDAKRLFRNGGYTDTICFHCQQAAEKYLKGFLIFYNREPKRVHDLVTLLEDCFKIDKKFKEILVNCRYLNKYYIEARYPVDVPILYSKKETKQALNSAQKIINFITSKIPDT